MQRLFMHHSDPSETCTGVMCCLLLLWHDVGVCAVFDCVLCCLLLLPVRKQTIVPTGSDHT